jgi:hypothetical protein
MVFGDPNKQHALKLNTEIIMKASGNANSRYMLKGICSTFEEVRTFIIYDYLSIQRWVYATYI